MRRQRKTKFQERSITTFITSNKPADAIKLLQLEHDDYLSLNIQEGGLESSRNVVRSVHWGNHTRNYDLCVSCGVLWSAGGNCIVYHMVVFDSMVSQGAGRVAAYPLDLSSNVVCYSHHNSHV